MNVADVRRLYQYNDWANERLLATIEALDDEQRTRKIESSFPSIDATLAHIAFAEWIWLRRWSGESPSVQPDWTTFDVVRDRLRETAAERHAYVDALTDESVSGSLSYRNMKGDPFTGNLGDLLLHCANHSTYHRGQLVTMPRQVGAKPPGTDFSEFIRVRSE
ncbi:MAG TPA: DinB family protein [Thermoanaerobaculia bacterium]|nr:DinB family protein [Thermoanaerobaculia bacterium]